jgi:hypothetical protein
MAFCENCNSEVSDGAWVCGRCGAPITRVDTPIAASDTTNPYVFSAQAQAEPAYQPARPVPPAAAKATPAPSGTILGLSRLTFAILVAAIVVVGCLALWYVFFSNGDGSRFLGTWAPVGSVGGAGAGIVGDGGRLIVSRSGGDYTVTTVDGKGQSAGPIKASLKRGKLEFGLEYAGTDQKERLKLQVVKAFVDMLVKDFHATLTARSDGTVYLSYSGELKNGVTQNGPTSVQLRRVSGVSGQ